MNRKLDSEYTVVKTIAEEAVRRQLRNLNTSSKKVDFVQNYGYSTGSGTGFNGTEGGGAIGSVGISMPTQFTVANSPLTADGTITITWASQVQNKIFASPTSGSGVPSFRDMVVSDMPISGVTAGTYVAPTITVDNRGRVTSAVNNIIPAYSFSNTQVLVGGSSNAINGYSGFTYDSSTSILSVPGSINLGTSTTAIRTVHRNLGIPPSGDSYLLLFNTNTAGVRLLGKLYGWRVTNSTARPVDEIQLSFSSSSTSAYGGAASILKSANSNLISIVTVMYSGATYLAIKFVPPSSNAYTTLFFDGLESGTSMLLVSASAVTNEQPFVSNSGGMRVTSGLSVGDAYWSVNPPTNGLIVEGNSGFNTSNPQALLHVGSTTSNAGNRSTIAILGGTSSSGLLNALSLINSAPTIATGQGVGMYFHTAGTFSPTAGIFAVAESDSNATTGLSLRTHNGSSIAERAYLTNSGRLRVSTGDDATTPGYSWLGDTGTGMYRVTASQIGFSLGGSLYGLYATTSARVGNESATNYTFRVIGAAGGVRALDFRSGTLDRWSIRANATAETGSNVGSDLQILRLDDTGASLGTFLFGKRSTGQVGINNSNPSARLHVTGNTGEIGFLVTGSGANLAEFRNGSTVQFSVGDNGDTTISGKARIFGAQRIGGNFSSTYIIGQVFPPQAGTPGSIVINTPIGRTDSAFFRIRVHGYWYNGSKIIDFTVTGYPNGSANGNVDGIPGRVFNEVLMDRGNDGLVKVVGINAAGKVAIAIGNVGTSYSNVTLNVECSVSNVGNDYSSGWSAEVINTAGLGFGDFRTLTASAYVDNNGRFIVSTSGANAGLSLNDWNIYRSGANIARTAGSLQVDTAFTVGSGTNAPILGISGAAGMTKQIQLNTGSTSRFIIYTDNDAESGTNLGSNFRISRWSDAGVFLGNAFMIRRDSGNISIGSNAGSASERLDIQDGNVRIRTLSTGYVKSSSTGVLSSSVNIPTSDVNGLEEYIQDTVAGFIVNGGGFTVNYDDPINKLTITVPADMQKSVYDTNDDGKVNSADSADSAPWTGITGKPTTFTPSAHTHVSADITDFYESVDDRVDALVIANNGIIKTYNDTSNTLTFSVDNEYIQDLLSTTLVAGTNISLNYNDVANTLTISSAGDMTKSVYDTDNDGKVDYAEYSDLANVANSALSVPWSGVSGTPSTYTPDAHTHTYTDITDFSEAVEDRVAAVLVAGTNISLVHDDGDNTITISSSNIRRDRCLIEFMNGITPTGTGADLKRLIPPMGTTDETLYWHANKLIFRIEAGSSGTSTIRLEYAPSSTGALTWSTMSSDLSITGTGPQQVDLTSFLTNDMIPGGWWRIYVVNLHPNHSDFYVALEIEEIA